MKQGLAQRLITQNKFDRSQVKNQSRLPFLCTRELVSECFNNNCIITEAAFLFLAIICLKPFNPFARSISPTVIMIDNIYTV